MKFVLVFVISLFPAIQMVKNSSWTRFKARHKKVYGSDDDSQREQVYRANLENIELHNERYYNGLEDIRLGMNHFCDMAAEEFMYLTTVPAPSGDSYYYDKPQYQHHFENNYDEMELPESVDWRDQNAVGPVKNQKRCGSCWAFATTGSIEGQVAIKYNKLETLSEQFLVDCSRSYGNHGCAYGYVAKSMAFVMQYGIATDQSYPYQAREGRCRYHDAYIAGKIRAYKRLPPGNETALKIAVAKIGPISVQIYHIPRLQFYRGGVITYTNCQRNRGINHEVMLVGYGTDDFGGDYWLVKNSWGKHWGEHGYFRLARHKNMCGIADFGIFPVLY